VKTLEKPELPGWNGRLSSSAICRPTAASPRASATAAPACQVFLPPALIRGVYEIEPGMPVSDMLELAGGTPQQPGSLLIGGYFGTWAAAEVLPLPFSAAGLTTVGATPGAGVVAVLPSSTCGLAETARLARYLASSSSGQCGPCVFGLDAIAGELERAAAGGSCDLPKVRHWLRDVTGRGACRHPDGTALMVASALRVFRAEIGLHTRGWCSATSGTGVLPLSEPTS
jgi:NADH:ubiquinone oxidoreductase subunit F (NADH-binding)